MRPPEVNLGCEGNGHKIEQLRRSTGAMLSGLCRSAMCRRVSVEPDVGCWM